MVLIPRAQEFIRMLQLRTSRTQANVDEVHHNYLTEGGVGSSNGTSQPVAVYAIHVIHVFRPAVA
jgi:hypothetical protein